jgi:hypothetical protein
VKSPRDKENIRESRMGGKKCINVSPLSPMFTGPIAVLQRGVKVFRIKVGESEETVSVDRDIVVRNRK